MSTNNVDSVKPKSVIRTSPSITKKSHGQHTSGQENRTSSDSSNQTLRWSYADHGSFQTGDPEVPLANQHSGRGGPTNLIINYLPQDMKEAELLEMFSEFGEIRKLKIIREPISGLSCCYGFVDFVSARQASAAQIALDGRRLRGKWMKVAFARPSCDQNRNVNLYVAHLPSFMDEQRLNDLFSSYGRVLDVNVLRNKITKHSRGVAFVRFERHQDAEAARCALDQHRLSGSYRPIMVKESNRQLDPPHPGRGGANHTSNGLQFKFHQHSSQRRRNNTSPAISKRRKEQEPQQDHKRSRRLD
uniref:ELAV-like protein 1 n=1 Tax=Drosophila rhopaloa TaxID=1041015 RepID=A0A6P4ERF4_DRORH